MACPCDNNRTVIDFMAQKKVKGQHPVISKLLDSLAELDKLTAVNPNEQREINIIRSKIETVTSFSVARLPEVKEKTKDEVNDNV